MWSRAHGADVANLCLLSSCILSENTPTEQTDRINIAAVQLTAALQNLWINFRH